MIAELDCVAVLGRAEARHIRPPVPKQLARPAMRTIPAAMSES
jgi:hypothetical protein